MTEKIIISKAQFRLWDHDDDFIQDLRTTLNQFGPVRLRTINEPAAGIGEFILILEVIGGSIAAGALAEIGADIYRRIFESIQKFYQRQQVRGAWRSGNITIKLSFDDADVVIYNPSEKLIGSLEHIVRQLDVAVADGALKGISISHVQMPMSIEPSEEAVVDPTVDIKYNDQTRFWGISTFAWTRPEYIYDSEDDKLLPNELLEKLLSQPPNSDNQEIGES